MLCPMPAVSQSPIPNPAGDADLAQTAWSAYWQSPRTMSCLAEGGLQQQSQLETDWRTFFHGLPDKARILDLACGNGAVALVAARLDREQARGFRIEGVDL